MQNIYKMIRVNYDLNADKTFVILLFSVLFGIEFYFHTKIYIRNAHNINLGFCITVFTPKYCIVIVRLLWATQSVHSYYR